MAIKIQAGMLPQYGRITMPKGTFLSNPSTAADGGLGGGGTTPPTHMAPVGLPKVPQITVGNFTSFVNLPKSNPLVTTAQNMAANPQTVLNPTGSDQPDLWETVKDWFS